MKSLVIYCFIAYLGSAIARAESHLVGTNVIVITPEFVNRLGEEARTNNPALRAADAKVASERHNEGTIRTWEDPMAQLGVMAANEEMRRDDGDILYGVEQKLPLFGKPKVARLAAKAQTAVEEANAEMQFQLLRKDIAQGIFRTALADRKVAIGREDSAWLEALLAVAEQRYEIGETAQSEVLRLQNELAKRRNDILTDEKDAMHERVLLNKSIGRDLHAPWPMLVLPTIAGPVNYRPKLVELAVQNEPKLNMLKREIQRAEAATEQVRRQRYPDINAGVEVRNYSGTGEFRQSMFTLSFNFPWGNRKKYDAEVKREQSKRQAAAFEADDYERTVRDEVFHLTIQIDAARREALLYRNEMIPRSETAVESARAAWEANRGTFRELLDSRRMLLDGQLMYARAVAEQYQMMAELILCCGLGDLEALQMIGAGPEPESEK